MVSAHRVVVGIAHAARGRRNASLGQTLGIANADVLPGLNLALATHSLECGHG